MPLAENVKQEVSKKIEGALITYTWIQKEKSQLVWGTLFRAEML